jgi:hypothetical protein
MQMNWKQIYAEATAAERDAIFSLILDRVAVYSRFEQWHLQRAYRALPFPLAAGFIDVVALVGLAAMLAAQIDLRAKGLTRRRLQLRCTCLELTGDDPDCPLAEHRRVASSPDW